jgi:hypothetical protein
MYRFGESVVTSRGASSSLKLKARPRAGFSLSAGGGPSSHHLALSQVRDFICAEAEFG